MTLNKTRLYFQVGLRTGREHLLPRAAEILSLAGTKGGEWESQGLELSSIVSAFVALGLALGGNHMLATATLCGADFLEPPAEEMNPSKFSPFSLAGTPPPPPSQKASYSFNLCWETSKSGTRQFLLQSRESRQTQV